jgi:tRNA pseudouridine38-40 synthase
MRYKTTIEYDGTQYAGWQIQPNAITIQETIQQALSEISGKSIKIHGSGRTDQGVHAKGQVAHFDLDTSMQTKNLQRGLNAVLPRDIRIHKIERVHDSFHARRSAVSKQYRYFIYNGPIMPALERLYKTHIRHPLDTSRMREAARLLVGEHDFASFSSSRGEDEPTVRILEQLDVLKSGRTIEIRTRSNGYLYKMVRSLVGFLIRVGDGSEPIESASELLEQKRRSARVPTAHPQGLFLWRVYY